MTERLHTPWTYTLIVSPLGMLLDTRLFEWIKDHFGVLVRLYRETDAQELFMAALDRAADRKMMR